MTNSVWKPSKEAVATAVTLFIALLLCLIYGLMVVRLIELDGIGWPAKALLMIFPALPPPLCLLLVRTYTQMMEDERAQALTESWTHCEREFLVSDEHRQVQQRIRNSGPAAQPDPTTAFNSGMRNFVLRRHPELSEMFFGVRIQQRDVKELARELARMELRAAGLNPRAYNLPILFFSCTYLIGLEVVIPLLETYATQGPVWPDLTLGEQVHVPLMVLQVGLLGGVVYSAFTLISRFLIRDITPRLFMVSGVRLILAPVGAVLLYLSPLVSVPGTSEKSVMETSHFAVLTYFVAGGFPFALLWTTATNVLSHLEFFQQRLMAGKRSTTLVEGITVFVAQRLSEEGIDVIQHLAFCDATDLGRRTRYSETAVSDWKDQAILYLLTGDCMPPGTQQVDGEGGPATLYDLLDQRAGIRTASALVRRIWEIRDFAGDAPQVRSDIGAFFRELGILPADDTTQAKLRCEELAFLFARLCEDAAAIHPSLRWVERKPSPSPDPSCVSKT